MQQAEHVAYLHLWLINWLVVAKRRFDSYGHSHGDFCLENSISGCYDYNSLMAADVWDGCSICAFIIWYKWLSIQLIRCGNKTRVWIHVDHKVDLFAEVNSCRFYTIVNFTSSQQVQRGQAKRTQNDNILNNLHDYSRYLFFWHAQQGKQSGKLKESIMDEATRMHRDKNTIN